MSIKTITFDDLINVVFGEHKEFPDTGSPAYELRESDLVLEIPIEAAEELSARWDIELYMAVDDEWLDDDGEIIDAPGSKIEFTMSADEVLDTSDNLKADFRCHFTDMDKDEISDGLIKKDDLEKWINDCLQNCVVYFNHFTVLGTWGQGVSDETSKSAIFANFKLEKRYNLSDLNPDWIDDEYLLEGFDDIERDSRIDTFDNW